MPCPVPKYCMLISPSRPVRYWPSVCCYDMSGTELACCYAMSATELAYAAMRYVVLGKEGSEAKVHPAMVLRTCYAMSGTDIAYAAVYLRTSYAMSGTDIAYAATRFWYKRLRRTALSLR
eukprot:2334586-Rhodomonas_salina.1